MSINRRIQEKSSFWRFCLSCLCAEGYIESVCSFTSSFTSGTLFVNSPIYMHIKEDLSFYNFIQNKYKKTPRSGESGCGTSILVDWTTFFAILSKLGTQLTQSVIQIGKGSVTFELHLSLLPRFNPIRGVGKKSKQINKI